MVMEKLRSWSWERQGLEGTLTGSAPRAALLRAGWSRSIGGASPYLSIFARTGASRERVDNDVANEEIHELPSARGCTYVVPKEQFALALLVGQSIGGDSQEIASAKKFLGVTEEELEKLGDATLRALEYGPLDPKGIKEAVGDAARSLGEEGRKRGASSTLPMVLGRLQSRGQIRRVPQNGRLDQQRYSYRIWRPGPLDGVSSSREDAMRELALLYFRWIGAATVAHFQWFTGLSGRAAKEAFSSLNLVEVDEAPGYLILAEEQDAFRDYVPPREPHFNLVGSLDSLLLLRRDLGPHLDSEDSDRQIPTDKALVRAGSQQDLYCNAIIDRGRLVGLWEFDLEAGAIVWTAFVPRNDELRREVARTKEFVREHLGDCRSFSLDSPESRVPKLKLLRQLAEEET